MCTLHHHRSTRRRAPVVSNDRRDAEFAAVFQRGADDMLPIVRPAGDDRQLALTHWGLIPWFSKDGKPSFSVISAR